MTHVRPIQYLCNTQAATLFEEETIDLALKILEDTKSTAIVVLDSNSLPIGIITERDIAKKAGQWDDILQKPASSLMSSPLLTLNQTTDFREAYMLMSEHKFRHLVVVDDQKKLVGVLGEGDFLKHLTPEQLLAVKEVKQIMSKDVMSASVDETLSQIITTMTSHKISSIVIIENDEPIGIFTERDALHLARHGDKTLSDSITKHMSTPIRTIDKDCSVLDAQYLLESENIRRLVVIDNRGKLVGILTQHDLVKGISSIYVDMLRDTIRKQSDILYDTYNRLEEQSVLNNILNTFSDRLLVACDINGIVEFTNSAISNCHYKVPDKGETLDDRLKCFNGKIGDSILHAESKTIIHKTTTIVESDGSKYIFKTSYTPILSANKQLQGLLFSAKDITSEMETKLELTQYKQLVSAITNKIVFIDKNYCYITVNDAYLQMHNKSREELIGTSVETLIGKKNFINLQPMLDRAFKGESISLNGVIYIDKEGNSLYEDVHLDPYKDSYGVVTAVVLNITDVTKERKSLIALQRSEDILAKTQKLVHIGSFEHDMNFKPLYLSKELFHILGFDPKEATPTFADFSSRVYKDDLTKFIHYLSGLSKMQTTATLEFRYSSPDGSLKNMLVHVEKSLNEQEALTSIRGTIQDITQLRESENSLLKSDERYKELFEGINDAVFVHPVVEKEFTKFNEVNEVACKRLGYTREELLQLTAKDIRNPNSKDKLASNRHKERLLKHGSAVFEIEQKTKSGELIPTEISSKLIYIDDKPFIMSMARDISERKIAEQKLQEQEDIMTIQSRQAAMGEMISMIAHQWRQPLSVVAMSANNLLLDIEMDELKEEDVKDGLHYINNQVQYMSSTIDDFRNFFQRSKTIEIEKVTTIIQSVLTIIQPSLNKNGIDIEVECDDSLTIETYVSELTQVIINILSNAKDALQSINSQKKIIISVKAFDDKISFAIYNNGPTIAEDIIHTIFEPYFTTKEKSGGTGIGLYMSKSIIQKHMNGSLKVQNRDSGVEFTILLEKKLPKIEEE